MTGLISVGSTTIARGLSLNARLLGYPAAPAPLRPSVLGGGWVVSCSPESYSNVPFTRSRCFRGEKFRHESCSSTPAEGGESRLVLEQVASPRRRRSASRSATARASPQPGPRGPSAARGPASRARTRGSRRAPRSCRPASPRAAPPPGYHAAHHGEVSRAFCHGVTGDMRSLFPD